MTFPAFIQVGWHQFTPPLVAGQPQLDAYGDVIVEPATSYTPPLESVGTQVNVIAIAPRSTEHVPLEGHDRIVTRKTMYANLGCPIGTYDYVDLPEGQYLVEGIGEDWSQGPFSTVVSGIEYQLMRETG
jgi:hypothetical protein